MLLQFGVIINIIPQSYVLEEGDYCCFPAGQRAGHHLFNHTEVNCTFITVGENKPNEVCYFPKSGTVRIRATGDVLKMAQN